MPCSQPSNQIRSVFYSILKYIWDSNILAKIVLASWCQSTSKLEFFVFSGTFSNWNLRTTVRYTGTQISLILYRCLRKTGASSPSILGQKMFFFTCINKSFIVKKHWYKLYNCLMSVSRCKKNLAPQAKELLTFGVVFNREVKMHKFPKRKRNFPWRYYSPRGPAKLNHGGRLFSCELLIIVCLSGVHLTAIHQLESLPGPPARQLYASTKPHQVTPDIVQKHNTWPCSAWYSTEAQHLTR